MHPQQSWASLSLGPPAVSPVQSRRKWAGLSKHTECNYCSRLSPLAMLAATTVNDGPSRSQEPRGPITQDVRSAPCPRGTPLRLGSGTTKRPPRPARLPEERHPHRTAQDSEPRLRRGGRSSARQGRTGPWGPGRGALQSGSGRSEHTPPPLPRAPLTVPGGAAPEPQGAPAAHRPSAREGRGRTAQLPRGWP